LCLEERRRCRLYVETNCQNRWFYLSRQIFENAPRGLQTRIFGHGLPVIGPLNLAAVKLALTDVGIVDRPHPMADDSTGF